MDYIFKNELEPLFFEEQPMGEIKSVEMNIKKMPSPELIKEDVANYLKGKYGI
jgi:hypothetical protein